MQICDGMWRQCHIKERKKNLGLEGGSIHIGLIAISNPSLKHIFTPPAYPEAITYSTGVE
jgi:hypothetical protein